MNRRGIFGPFILLILFILVITAWALLMPNAIEPAIDIGLNGTASATHSDGVEFMLRMLPWAVPAILAIGFLWLAVSR